MSTQISRRRAIGAGTIAAIAAGLLGTTTAEALTPANPTLATVVNFEQLAEESRRLSALCQEMQQATGPASEALMARIGREHYDLALKYMEGPHDNQRDVWHDLVVAELMRHLPGLAPAIGVVWLHIMTNNYNDHGYCCIDTFDGRA
jgi:hypothetical protein